MDEWLQEEPIRGQESQGQEGPGGIGPGPRLRLGWWAGPCEQVTGWTELYTRLCQDNPVSLKHWKGRALGTLREGWWAGPYKQNQGQVDKLEVSSSMCFAKVGGKRQSVAVDGFPIQDGNTMEAGNTGTPKNTLEGLFEMDKEDIQVGKAKEEGLDVLREALCAERNMLAALETELENERNAAAIATGEARAMISRLQEAKSAMQLEVAQLQRMAKEKVEYDELVQTRGRKTCFGEGS
ncbi:hypothetical protein L7F22_047915 [Adiantum nelumboides]|nr:hypothetical protein [Adiantum nelumboides]